MVDEAKRPLPPSKVLVVDDNAQQLELLLAYMEDLPEVTLVPAMDGEEALARVATDHPDLVLLDLMIPKISGFEVCRRLKSSPETRDVPVVMVTALSEMGDIERGVECGTDDFLTKPVNRVELVTRVRSLLRMRHLKRDLDRTLAQLDRVDPPSTSPDADASE